MFNQIKLIFLALIILTFPCCQVNKKGDKPLTVLKKGDSGNYKSKDQKTLNLEETYQDILSTLRTGDLETAIQMLPSLNIDEHKVILLSGRIEDLNRISTLGIVSFQDYLITKSRINMAILSLLPERKQETISPNQKDSIKNLIEDNELEKAINIIDQKGHEIAIFFQARRCWIKEAEVNALAASQFIQIEKTKLKLAIKSYLEE